MTPILVAGLGRCGSSLTMQMLHSIRVPCLGESPAFEPACVGLTHNRPATVLGFAGASKVLDPFYDEWPDQFDAKVIWLDRDRRQQAKSQVKILREFGGIAPTSSQAWRPIAKALRDDRATACRRFWSRCRAEPLFLRFEEIIDDPLRAARLIAKHIGRDSGVTDVTMARCVLKRRSDCTPDMSIELGLCTPRA